MLTNSINFCSEADRDIVKSETCLPNTRGLWRHCGYCHPSLILQQLKGLTGWQA